jgi:cytochrome P450
MTAGEAVNSAINQEQAIDHTTQVALPPRLIELGKGVTEQGDRVAFRQTFILCHPNAVRDVLVAFDAKMIKPRALRWARLTLGKGLLTSDGELHRRQRPIIQPTLHPKRLAGYASTMVHHSVETANRWRDGQSIDAREEMTRLTLHIVADALFGAALGPEVDAISSAMDYNVRAFLRLTRPWGKILGLLPTPFTIKYLLSRHKVLSVLRRFVAARRSSGVEKDDLLGRLIAARTPDGQPAMSEKQLIDECVTLFAAGHETTANALTYTLWLLALNPHVQARLSAEIAYILPDPKSRPTIDDVDRLPYARMVLCESMRLYPPAWIQGRELTENLTIDGTPFRRGGTVYISQWITHRDARWWADPLRFDPDRFDSNVPALSADGSPRPRWAYFPFGGGSRSCIGEAFAWTELILALAVLVQHWRFEPSPAAEPIRLEPGITLRPGSSVKLIVRARSLSDK